MTVLVCHRAAAAAAARRPPPPRGARGRRASGTLPVARVAISSLLRCCAYRPYTHATQIRPLITCAHATALLPCAGARCSSSRRAMATAARRRLGLLGEHLHQLCSAVDRANNILHQLPSSPKPAAAAKQREVDENPTGKPRLAIICTVWYYLTHAQHEGDRFNHGWPMNGEWHEPQVELVSIYADQKGREDTHGTDPNDPDKKYTGDLTALREAEFPNVTVYPTIAEALRCGGDQLAVDAVLIIGEHGDYQTDEYQMTQ
jgi:hypothetical protein